MLRQRTAIRRSSATPHTSHEHPAITRMPMPEPAPSLDQQHPPSHGQSLQPQHVLHYQKTLGNQAVQRMLSQATVQRDIYDDIEAEEATETAPPPSATGYIGLNPKAKKEVTALSISTVGQHFMASVDDPKAEEGLKTHEGRMKFIDEEIAIDVFDDPFAFLAALDCIEDCDPAFREQMAQLMRMFNGAQKGQYILERLVMSGHSDGVKLWGDKEGNSNPGSMLLNRDLVSLARAFPVAASQVEDVMFSACWTASNIQLMQKIFPNLKTAWAYLGYSPDIAGGSSHHIQQWERVTRGEAEPVGPKDARGKAAVWTASQGFIAGDPAGDSKEAVLLRASEYLDRIDKQIAGEEPIDKPYLDNAYSAMQEVIAHPGTEKEHLEIATEYKNKLLRMRYWGKMMNGFALENAAAISAAYGGLGINAPTFASMNRKDIKTHMEAFQKALDDAKASDKDKKFDVAQEFYTVYLQGIWDFNEKILKAEWA